MAEQSEHRMLFDLRGRRKNVVKVVYAILAILMGASLFLTVGPLSITDVFSGSSSSSADSVLTDQAEKIEQKLKKDPTNEDLLLQDVRIRVSAGNTAVETDGSGNPQYTQDVLDQYELAADSWKKYLAQNPSEPNPNVALLVANALYVLGATSTDPQEVQERLADAAEAQQIVADARPTLNSLATLAQFQYLAGNTKAGDEALAKAKKKAPKNQQKALESQLTQYKTIGKQLSAEVKKAEGKPGSQLENPLGGSGLGTGDSSGLSTTTPSP